VTADVIAEHINLNVSMLYAWATDPTNPSRGHRCMHLSWLLPATRASQNYVVMDALEHHLERQTPGMQHPYPGTTMQLVRTLNANMAKAVSGLTNAMMAVEVIETEALQPMLPTLRQVRESINQLDAKMLTLVQELR
jgi:hypothetical protein